MSQFRKLTDQVSVSPQIREADIDEAAAGGVTLIINNRPDGEELDQPTNENLAAYAAEKGVSWAFIPVVSGQLTMESIIATSAALKDHDKILAYCRTGTRSCNIWGLAQAYASTLETGAILEKAASAGYDLSAIAPTLEHLQNT